MGNEKEFVCIFANGKIITKSAGATFECERVKVMKVDEDITLDELKRVFGQKL